ncbi:uncharacterized protein LOC128548183 [Mercenaria mercenaria]|uniref:uncharacterized protein LOC128548183 n=1 Tax=Mercenaria mercenaria TaxID=6596 RepID=UPI00234F9065|nr:uncharacterized protein LOC128548183 [Mercenaria mercenaria]
MFFEGKQDKYVQYLMLLVDAGRLVFIAYLQKLLAKQEESLAKLLLDKRELLQENLTSQEMKTLCLDENPNTDMESWDMSVLGSVILTVFGSSIKRKKRDAIKCIKKVWKNYASTATEVVDRERFLHCEEDLVSALRSLSGSDEYEKIEELIERYRSPMEDDGNNVSYFEKLERHGVKMARIEDEYKGNS